MKIGRGGGLVTWLNMLFSKQPLSQSNISIKTLVLSNLLITTNLRILPNSLVVQLLSNVNSLKPQTLHADVLKTTKFAHRVRQITDVQSTDAAGVRFAVVAFVSLVNGGWNLSSIPYANVHVGYKFILDRSLPNLGNQARCLHMLNNSQLKKIMLTNTSGCNFNALAQFRNVANFLFMLKNAASTDSFPVFFNQPRFVKFLSFFNWAALRISNSAWPLVRFLFFYKLQTEQSVKFITNLGTSDRLLLLFFISTSYHRRELVIARSLNYPTGSLTNLSAEPWVSDFPVFCDGVEPHVQLLFTNLIASSL